MPERTRMKNHKFWCVCLVSLLLSLDGCERDAVKTQSNNFTKIKMAAEAGEPMAQCNLGLLYLNGFEVPQDDKKAAIWFRAAAEQGNAYAQRFNLGVMYHDGRGVSQDYADAVKWYRLAADQGYADAQGNLGVMYHDGRGVPQDYGEAYAWFSVAAAFGDANAANNRDIVAGELTREQLWPWQKRATELFEKISGGK